MNQNVYLSGDAPTLEIHHPDRSVSSYELQDHPRVTVGRHPTTDLVLAPTASISRIQLEIVFEEPYYYLLNRSTTVPTLLNGHSVPALQKHPEPLHHNDYITFGLYSLIFKDQNDTRLQLEPPKTFERPAKSPRAGDITPRSVPIPGSVARQDGFELKEDGTVNYRGIQDHLSPRLYHFLVCLYRVYPETCKNEEIEAHLLDEGYSLELHRLATDTRNFFKQRWGAQAGLEPPNIESLRKFGYRLVLD